MKLFSLLLFFACCATAAELRVYPERLTNGTFKVWWQPVIGATNTAQCREKEPTNTNYEFNKNSIPLNPSFVCGYKYNLPLSTIRSTSWGRSGCTFGNK